jgi:ABC-type phosphate transport system permease subunit
VAQVLDVLTVLPALNFLLSLQASDFSRHTSAFSLRTFQKSPIIVKLVEPHKDPTGLAEVLIGALGLTGVITLIAVALGVLTALIMLWMRSRRSA